jgi:protein-S-isoprenylcysteine O-methyltransferase Ste14
MLVLHSSTRILSDVVLWQRHPPSLSRWQHHLVGGFDPQRGELFVRHLYSMTAALDAAPPSCRDRTPRTAADWIGCVSFCAFAAALALSSGNIGLLLLPPMLYELLVAITFLVRCRARRVETRIVPRIAAYAASFLVPVFIWASVRWAPAYVATSESSLLRTIGASSWLFGSLVAFWPIWYMRASFSVEPAAREFASAGPYRLARHPIYATQIFEYVGVWLLHATLQLGIVIAVWFILVRIRVRAEERVMTAEFPEYELYAERVGPFAPRLSRRERERVA